MPITDFPWQYLEGQKRHTQDGFQLVSLMKSIGHGKIPVLAVDVGCGDGVIAYEMIKNRRATKVIAFDISREAVAAATHNLSRLIREEHAEVLGLSAHQVFKKKKLWDAVDRFVINPPFFAAGSGRPNKRRSDQRARHDHSLKLELWAGGARRLLKTGGELYCVFPTERLAELLAELSRNSVEPKELWWFKDDLRKRRFFLRAVRSARPGLVVHFDWLETFR